MDVSGSGSDCAVELQLLFHHELLEFSLRCDVDVQHHCVLLEVSTIAQMRHAATKLFALAGQ